MSEPRRGRIAAALDWTFRNRRTGAITVGQWPNVPLWIFLGFSILAWAIQAHERFAIWLGVAARVALAWWAVDEVVRGVNPWRRFLGATVLAGLLVAVLYRATI